MTANTLEERKRQVQQIRASFSNAEDSKRYGDLNSTRETSASRPGISWRFLAAALLFCGFLYCERNEIPIAGYTAAQLCQELQVTFSPEKALQTMESMIYSEK